MDCHRQEDEMYRRRQYRLAAQHHDVVSYELSPLPQVIWTFHQRLYFVHEEFPVFNVDFLNVLVMHEGSIQRAMSLHHCRHRKDCQMRKFVFLVLSPLSDGCKEPQKPEYGTLEAGQFILS